MEELLITTPLDQYATLLRIFDHSLRSHTALSSGPPVELPQDHVRAPEEDSTEQFNVIVLFEKMCIARGTKDDHFKVKEADAMWSRFVRDVEALQLGFSPTALIRPDTEFLREVLQSHLRTPCPKKARHFATCTHKSAFRGWKLLDHARVLDRAAVLE